MSIEAIKTINSCILYLNAMSEELQMVLPTLGTERFQFTKQESCIFCINFNEVNEVCSLCNLRPPARVLVRGCPKFTLSIPF